MSRFFGFLSIIACTVWGTMSAEAMKYTFVLTPNESNVERYIDASQTLFSGHEPYYLLKRDGTSAPHITVVQFEAPSFQVAKQAWDHLCEKLSNQDFTEFAPPFSGVAFVNGEGPYEGTTWVEVSVKRGEEHSPLMQLHYAALETLEELGIKPLNASGSNYRPHLTLSRVALPDTIVKWPEGLFAPTQAFSFEFGKPDGEWQYSERIDVFSSSQ